MGGDCLLGDGMSETVIIVCDACSTRIGHDCMTHLKLDAVNKFRSDLSPSDFCNFQCLYDYIVNYRPEVSDGSERAEYDRLRKKFGDK